MAQTFEAGRVLVARALASFDQFHGGMTTLVADLPLPRPEMTQRLEATTVHLDAALGAMSGARLTPGAQATVSHAYDGLKALRGTIDYVFAHPEVNLEAINWKPAFDATYGLLGEAAIAVA